MSFWSSLAARISCLTFASLVIGSLAPHSANAQGAFCPSVAGTQARISLQSGTCTNGTTGAFSGAALASQALSDLGQSTTQESTNTAVGGISERRATEAAACEPGLVRIDGICQAPAVVRPIPAPVERATTKRARPARKVVRAAPPEAHRARPAPELPSTKGPVAPLAPALSPPSGYHFGVWAHGYGDYERRSGTSASSINCCSGSASNLTSGLAIPLIIDARSTTNTGGFVGGIDLTARSLFAGGDGLIVGLLAGYVSSDVNVRASILSTNPSNLNNGFARVKATLSGPSAGIYATYFNGAFSNDLLLKNDFLDLNETTNQLLAFTANIGVPPATLPFFGAGKTNLNQFTAADNVNYKFILSPSMWVEPTAGIQYTLSSYGSGAALLGLKDGYILRLQGGARFGFDTFLGPTRMTTTLTGLLYDNVIVHGDFIQGGAFGIATNALKDEGKVRAEGIVALNFDLGNGVSTFVQGEVRGGQGLFGAGGRAGLRVQW